MINFFNSRLLWGSLVAIGIVGRLREYFFNRSLWFDEAVLASSLIHRPFWELLKPLDYGQIAPFGFLLAEKLSVTLLGNNEFGLRLFPLLCGIVSIFLFYRIAAEVIDGDYIWLAVLLFSINGAFIYYSTEVKQYSTDVCMAVLLLLFHLKTLKSITHFKKLILCGIISVWFSHTVIFILAASFLTLLISQWSVARKKETARILTGFTFCFLSFAVSFWVTQQGASSQLTALLKDYWKEYFLQLPLNFWNLNTSLDLINNFIKVPGGIYYAGLGILTSLLGFYSFSKKNFSLFLFFVIPFLAMGACSLIHLYPFSERLILFLAPILIILITEGVGYIARQSSQKQVLIPLLVGILIFHPVLSFTFHLIHPRTREEIKMVLDYLQKHYRPTETVYIHPWSLPALNFYTSRTGYMMTGDEKKSYTQTLAEIKKIVQHKRVWLIFSHATDFYGLNEQKLYLHELDQIGKRLDSYEIKGIRFLFFENTNVYSAAAYLYDFSSQADPSGSVTHI